MAEPEDLADTIRRKYGEEAEEVFWDRYKQGSGIVDWPLLQAVKSTGRDDYIEEARETLKESGYWSQSVVDRVKKEFGL